MGVSFYSAALNALGFYLASPHYELVRPNAFEAKPCAYIHLGREVYGAFGYSYVYFNPNPSPYTFTDRVVRFTSTPAGKKNVERTPRTRDTRHGSRPDLDGSVPATFLYVHPLRVLANSVQTKRYERKHSKKIDTNTYTLHTPVHIGTCRHTTVQDGTQPCIKSHVAISRYMPVHCGARRFGKKRYKRYLTGHDGTCRYVSVHIGLRRLFLYITSTWRPNNT